MTDGAAQPAPDVPAPPARPTRHDPWAHRRGEPRIFVFGWTVFLFVATLVTFVSAQAAAGGDRAVIRSAARLLVLASAIGITVLWPMVRLSQWPEPHPVRGTFRDLVVLLVPVQAMLWPQTMWWLAHWPMSVVGAVDLLLVCWGALAGGVVALVQTLRWREWRRTGAVSWGLPVVGMIASVVLVTLGALPAISGIADPFTGSDTRPPDVRVGWMLSPFTGIFEVARERAWAGVPAAVRPAHAAALLLGLLMSVPVWAVAARLTRGLPRAPGLH